MKKNMKLKFVLFAIILFIYSCDSFNLKDGLYAKIKTNYGNFICELYFEDAPVTVGNFVGLAEGSQEWTDPKTGEKKQEPFYTGLIFHRIIKGFVIQGGDPKGNGTGGPGYNFVDELDTGLSHDSPGILSMANSGANSNGSQFFITLSKTEHLDGAHSVFGKVVEGMDIVNKISEVPVDDHDKPYDDVFIKSIKIIRVGKKAKNFDSAEAFSLNEEKLKKYQDMKKKQAEEFLLKLDVDESKMKTTDIGLKYIVKTKGSGRIPSVDDKVLIELEAYLEDGTKFISTSETKNPIETIVGTERIPGLDKSLVTMKTGERRIVILPYFLAFGENGLAPVIPPKATIIIDVKLLEIH